MHIKKDFWAKRTSQYIKILCEESNIMQKDTSAVPIVLDAVLSNVITISASK